MFWNKFNNIFVVSLGRLVHRWDSVKRSMGEIHDKLIAKTVSSSKTLTTFINYWFLNNLFSVSCKPFIWKPNKHQLTKKTDGGSVGWLCLCVGMLKSINQYVDIYVSIYLLASILFNDIKTGQYTKIQIPILKKSVYLGSIYVLNKHSCSTY